MNPNIDKFPMPSTGPTGANMQGGEFGAPNQAVEQLPSREATSFAPHQPSMPVAPVALQGNLAVQATPAVPVQGTAPAPSVPVATGTGEELEKKWVAVAKTIVERTQDNPYLQNQELSKAGMEFRRQSGRSFDPDKE